MTVNEILSLDYETTKGKNIIQKALRKIKPLSGYDFQDHIPLSKLEILAGKYQRKYCFMIDYITPVCIPGERDTYCATIKRTDNLNHIGYVFGSSMYELFAKVCIKFHSEVNKGNIPEHDWDKVKKEREQRLKELMGK